MVRLWCHLRWFVVAPMRRRFLLPGCLRGWTEAWNSISSRVKKKNAISDQRVLSGIRSESACRGREVVNLGLLNLPGDISETGVLDGVGLCPGGRKCEGDPLLEPPPGAETGKMKDTKYSQSIVSSCLCAYVEVWLPRGILTDRTVVVGGVGKQTPLPATRDPNRLLFRLRNPLIIS